MARDHRIQVHLGERDPSVLHRPPRDELEPVEERSRRRAVMGFHDRDGDILAGVPQAMPLLEHHVGLADPRCGAEQHPEPSAHGHRPAALLVPGRVHRGKREVQLQHVDGRFAQIAEVPGLGVRFDQLLHAVGADAARLRHGVDLKEGVGG